MSKHPEMLPRTPDTIYTNALTRKPIDISNLVEVDALVEGISERRRAELGIVMVRYIGPADGRQWCAPVAKAAVVVAELAAREVRIAAKNAAAGVRATEVKQAREDALRVFGIKGPWTHDEEEILATGELARAMATVVSFKAVKSKKVRGVGGHKATVFITLPSGRSLSAGHLVSSEVNQISERVAEYTSQVPVFPVGAGFKVVVGYYVNRGYTESW
jgi:hypothetical protein